MLLYYAMGGGLGHLTRARAFLHTLGLEERAALLTSSRFADDPRVTGGLRVVRVPDALDGDRDGLRRLLERTIGELGVRRLVVDALPAGILGELALFRPPAGLELWHVARLLRWERYVADASSRLPRFERVYVVEELHPAHRHALESASEELVPIDLVDPPSAAPERLARPEPPYVLVVHSGPDEETADLIACARELACSSGAPPPRLVLASPARPAGLPPDVTWLDSFPATGLFVGATRIVAAAGFNTVRQTAPFRTKRFLVPYPRRFDDQFTRAVRAARAETTGRPKTKAPA